jgi:hypothetical protein
MNTKRISMVAVMTLVLVTVALSPGLAAAQQRESEGKFTLPCTTYWGTAVLPAGTYTFSLSRVTKNVDILDVRGGKSFKVMAIVDPDYANKENALEVRRSGGSAVVTNMHLAEGGININFRVAPVARELMSSASVPQGLVEKIAVTVD